MWRWEGGGVRAPRGARNGVVGLLGEWGSHLQRLDDPGRYYLQGAHSAHHIHATLGREVEQQCPAQVRVDVADKDPGAGPAGGSQRQGITDSATL